MKYAFLAAGFAALSLAACTTTADQQSASNIAPAAVSSSGEVDMNEVVCRKQRTTGTRFAREVCQTRQQWEDAAKAGGNPIDNAARRSLQFSPENG